MRDICFYFQVHQPYRLKRYTVFDIGKNPLYYDDELNKKILQRVAKESYLPMNRLLLGLLQKHNLKVAFSISGILIEQCKEWVPEVIESFRELADTGRVEFLCETYYHSLAGLHDRDEFKEQILKQKAIIEKEFGVQPTTFRNTELILTNDILNVVQELGFQTVLGEGAKIILEDVSADHLFRYGDLSVLLRNYERSDDIAFRFSDRSWSGWPLSPKKFLRSIPSDASVTNLFMDYETFGEHQKEHSGLFRFMEALPLEAEKQGFRFITPQEAVKFHEPKKELDLICPVSWADQEKDLSAWMGNKMQVASLRSLYELGTAIKEQNDANLLRVWRGLQCSDHFYYMCIKWFNDGDVHKYFSPYDSPYDAFIAFMNVLNDLVIRVKSNEKVVTA